MFDHKTQQNSNVLYDSLLMKDILNYITTLFGLKQLDLEDP